MKRQAFLPRREQKPPLLVITRAAPARDCLPIELRTAGNTAAALRLPGSMRTATLLPGLTTMAFDGFFAGHNNDPTVLHLSNVYQLRFALR